MTHLTIKNSAKGSMRDDKPLRENCASHLTTATVYLRLHTCKNNHKFLYAIDSNDSYVLDFLSKPSVCVRATSNKEALQD